MIDHHGVNLDEPPDDRVYGWLDALAPECRVPNQVEQIVGKTSDEKPCLIGCKPVAARLVPSECVLSFFYPVLDLSPTIVDDDYLFRFKVRVGHNKSHTREDLTHMPFDFTDNPPGLNPFLRLVTQLDHPRLHSALWGTTGRPLQMGFDELLEAAVTGKPDEVGDAPVFAELVESGTGKCRIPRSQNCLNQDR